MTSPSCRSSSEPCPPRPAIRLARPEDAQRCGEIAVAAWRCIFEGWRELIGERAWQDCFGDWEQQKRSSVTRQITVHPQAAIVTELGGEIVGFLTWRLDPERGVGEISNNAVDPPHQGRGIGSAQVRRALEVFRAEGMTSARVLTGGDEGHAPARAMYRKAGFTRGIPLVEYFREL
ncbi:MAG: GNAT family N-acetyltransferase [Armatimonadota bacterium]